MLTDLLQLAIVAWLPGAAIFRAPVAERDRRASFDFEERLFWAVMVSLGISLALTMGLAYLGRYTFERLLVADVAIAAVVAVVSRLDLRLGSAARRPALSILLPVLLITLGAWRFFPPAEYVIGGRDPGVYVNEGVQIAQRGTFLYEDPVVASVPAFARDLFFPSHGIAEYYGTRFMGFYLVNPETGLVVGQFPHLYPASIAIAYGIDGLTGVRRATGWWAILGLLGVYFLAARLFGRAVGFAAAALLALTLVQVWFARYPNSEVMTQALLFASMLALVRAYADELGYFAPIAGLLLGLCVFVRIDAALAIVAALAAVALQVMAGGRWRWGFIACVGVMASIGVAYTLGPMRAYAHRPVAFLTNLQPWHYTAIAAAGLALLGGVTFAGSRPALRAWIRSSVPGLLSASLIAAAAYALYFRQPGGTLTDYNAYALRTFTQYYFTLPALLAALIGFTLASRRAFWVAPAFFIIVAAYAFFFFYKIWVVPEHFWMARRFVAVIVPAGLVFAAVAALGMRAGSWFSRIPRQVIGSVFLVLLAREFVRASEPIMNHVEYAGVIPRIERLASTIHDNDLLIVESRNAGTDVHTLAVPLAYIYDRNVLVLDSPVPDKLAFAGFLQWAAKKYARVLFLGAGGTELLSPDWSARALTAERFQVPEYDAPGNEFPRYARAKQFDYTIYELAVGGRDEASDSFDLDLGASDDLNVLRFYAKEESEGRSFRWSRDVSYVVAPAIGPATREVVLWMSDGGRPEAGGTAQVTVEIADRPIGSAHVTTGFKPYTFQVPAEVAAAVSGKGPTRIRIRTVPWKPVEVLGTGDDRDLGVMIDRVTLR